MCSPRAFIHKFMLLALTQSFGIVFVVVEISILSGFVAGEVSSGN